jgi:hypothetical protein
MRIAAPEMVMRSRNYKSTNVARQFLSLEKKLSFQIDYYGSLKIHIFLERGEKRVKGSERVIYQLLLPVPSNSKEEKCMKAGHLRRGERKERHDICTFLSESTTSDAGRRSVKGLGWRRRKKVRWVYNLWEIRL